MLDPSAVWQALWILPLLLLPTIHIINCSKSRRPRREPVSLRSKTAPSRGNDDPNVDVRNEQAQPPSIDSIGGAILPLTGRDEGGADGNANIFPLLSLPPELHVKIFGFLSAADRLRARVNRYFLKLEAGEKQPKYKLDRLLVTDDGDLVAQSQFPNYTIMYLNNNNGKTYKDYVTGLEKLNSNSTFYKIILKVEDTQWIGKACHSFFCRHLARNELMYAVIETEAPMIVFDIVNEDARKDWLCDMLIEGRLSDGRTSVSFGRSIELLSKKRDIAMLQRLFHRINSSADTLRSIHFDGVPFCLAKSMKMALGYDDEREFDEEDRTFQIAVNDHSMMIFEVFDEDERQGMFAIHRLNEDGTMPHVAIDYMGQHVVPLDHE